MAFAALDQTAFDAMLKELYPDFVPEHTALQRYPLMMMLNKQDNFEGDALVVPVQYEFPQGRSATFALAQSNARPSKMVKWVAAQKMDYGNVVIDALTIRASRGNRGAFVKARKNEIDGMLRNLGRSASIAAYGSGSGSIGQVSSISTTTITLTEPEDVINFGVAQTIAFDTVDGGGTVKTSPLEVASRDPDAGTVTFTTTAAGGGGEDPATSDFMFVSGDYDLKLLGLAAWLPLTAPTGGDSHLGVDRSVDPTRLAGQRVDATGNSIEENILTLGQKIVREGGQPDTCFLSHTNFSNLVKGLGTKVEYQGAGGRAGVGFRGVEVHTSAGVINCFPDPACPANRGYVLDMPTWTVHHLDGFPHLDTIDGNRGLRSSGADSIEVRARYWAELICTAPGWNGVFSI